MTETFSYIIMLLIILLLCFKLVQHYQQAKKEPTARNRTMTIALAGVIIGYSFNAFVGLFDVTSPYLTSNGTALVTGLFLAVYIASKFFSKDAPKKAV